MTSWTRSTVLVVIFLEQAELRVKERKQLSLDYWRGNVDKLLEFNERPVLQGAGSISHDDMKSIARDHYATFATQRKAAEALSANAEDVKELDQVGKAVEKERRCVVSLNRYFYQYVPPRPLAEIGAEMKTLEAEIANLLKEVAG